MRLSVVIPVYNREELVGEAIESVLAQQIAPAWQLELIVVDDGSTDASRERAEAALRRGVESTATRLLSIDHRGRPGAVRNVGIGAATGELIAFLDSDDLWLPGKLTHQLALHRSGTPYHLSHTRERWLRGDREVSQRGQRHRRTGDILADALHKCIIGPSTAIVSRDLVERAGPFRDDLEVAEDYEFWLRCLCHTEAHYSAVPGTLKRAGEWDQLSARYRFIEPFRIDALAPLVSSRYFETHRSAEVQRLAHATLMRKCDLVIAGARKRGNTELFERYSALRDSAGLSATLNAPAASDMV